MGAAWAGQQKMQAHSLGSGPGRPQRGPQLHSTLLAKREGRAAGGFLPVWVRVPAAASEAVQGVTCGVCLQIASWEDGVPWEMHRDCD